MDGISFIVRAHNEEATLFQSVSSLFGVLLAYEVVLILNACTDNSTQIAAALQQANPAVRVFTYDPVLSRPGYETLATDEESPHSLSAYYNWSLKQARYRWVVKWDADFVMTPTLLNYINNINLLETQIVRMGAVNLDGDVEYNDYMSSCLGGYKKDVFWEMPGYTWGCAKITINATIQHLSRRDELKAYWMRPGWYTQESSEEAHAVLQRVRDLEHRFGEMPVGLVRSERMREAIEWGERVAGGL
jgi:glycosyltransferase involved in cell wall biosynthesis